MNPAQAYQAQQVYQTPYEQAPPPGKRYTYRPVDGFSLVQDIYPHLIHHQPSHALAQFDPWRRARTFTMRWIVAPDEENITIPIRGTVEYQAKLTPGSWWWGVNVGTLSAGGLGPPPPAHVVGIIDQATGREILSDVVEVRQLDMAINYNINGDPGGPILLDQPYPVMEPGLFDFRIYNTSTTAAVTFQIVLFVMEPCRGMERPDCI